ncbi:MAG: sulfatase, partial [Nanohaloarchaea archaeon SW_10_44_10]
DAVDEYELEDSTAVIHTADHGDMTGSHRQFNKGPMMYEETYHIPLIMKWPGEIEPGTSTDSFAHLHDLTATFLDMADIKIPDEMQSQSLMPVVNGDETRETAFAQYHGDEFGLYSQRMLRKGDWKYIYNGPDIDEMYNLENDPAELENLVESDENVEKRNELRSILADEMDRTDDPIRKWVGEMLNRSSSESGKDRQEIATNKSTGNI